MFIEQKYDAIWPPFCFLARYIRLSVGASIFRFCFVYFVSLLLSIRISGFLGAFFPILVHFCSYHFLCVARTRRVGVGDATSSRTAAAAIASHAILRIGPFVRYFRFIYISKAFEKNPNPMRECRQKAPKTRRCHHHRAVEHFRCQSCVNYAIKLSFTLFRASCKTLRSADRQRVRPFMWQSSPLLCPSRHGRVWCRAALALQVLVFHLPPSKHTHTPTAIASIFCFVLCVRPCHISLFLPYKYRWACQRVGVGAASVLIASGRQFFCCRHRTLRIRNASRCCLSIRLSVCASVSLSVRLSVCLAVFLVCLRSNSFRHSAKPPFAAFSQRTRNESLFNFI